MVLLALAALLMAPAVPAEDLASTCHATSSYDLTLSAQGLLFDRAAPAPMRVELHDGTLRANGAPVHLSLEEQDRLALFERDLRALVPRVRTVAQNGVDLAASAMRDEAVGMNLSDATQAELRQRLATRAAELKQRIADSNSTHDWQRDAINQYANQVAGEIGALIAADLGRQAIDAAMSGDLQAAASLRDKAGDLSVGLRPRLEQRMQALRPQIRALCPEIERLAELQRGIEANGHPLDLLSTTRSPRPDNPG
jgi:hypothetical protein